MRSRLYLGLIVFIIFFMLLFSTACDITGNVIEIDNQLPYDLEAECVMSRCDCKCYSKGKLPEINEGRLCNTNCEQYYDAEVCVKINNECVLKKVDEPNPAIII